MSTPKETVISSAYRDLAIGFMSVVFLVTVVRSLLKEFLGGYYVNVFIFLFAPIMVGLFVLSFRVFSKLQVKKSTIYGLVALLLVAVVARFISFITSDHADSFTFSLISSLLIMMVWAAIIYRMVLNLFGESTHIVEKLWASVCIFFMIGVVFGSYYSIVLAINPASMGIEMKHPMEIFIYGMIYSLNILSGFDPVFQSPSESLQMGAIMESLLTTLFLVVLLGRLLGAPAQDR